MTKEAEVGTRRQRRAYAPRMPLEQRRRQLLDAALALIVREGYAGLTIEAIAQEAGVTKPVVYSAYANLSLLLTALLDRTQSDAVTQLLAAFPQDPRRLTSKHLAGDIARAWARAVRENPQTWTPVLSTGAQTPAPVLDRIEQGREVVRKALADFIGRGRDLDAATARHHLWTAHAVVAAAEHFGHLVLTRPDAITDDELAALFDDLVNGLLRRT
ncbi:helix-turn-helix domain-containing protein [Actinoallomurus sp. NPDC050550]|uniref:TetR/AcrR family transcriptional regulator n=1 Tax=Actinoallomurus sp. NPDC050550 TaxID=3154937 RepID=UPI0033FCD247